MRRGRNFVAIGGALAVVACQGLLDFEPDAPPAPPADAAAEVAADAPPSTPPDAATPDAASDAGLRFCEHDAYVACADFDHPGDTVATYEAQLRGGAAAQFDEELFLSSPRGLRFRYPASAGIMSNYFEVSAIVNASRFRIEFGLVARSMPVQDALGDVVATIHLRADHQIILMSFDDRLYLQDQELSNGGAASTERNKLDPAGAKLSATQYRRVTLDFSLGASPKVDVDVSGTKGTMPLAADITPEVLDVLRFSVGVVHVDNEAPTNDADVTIDDVAVTLL